MITELYMENCALVDQLTYYPKKGLNIITGETGSGKSIILESIRLCMGGKYDSTFLRKGSKKGSTEITITDISPEILMELKKFGLFDEEEIVNIDNDLDIDDEKNNSSEKRDVDKQKNFDQVESNLSKTLIVNRTFFQDGKSTARVNGRGFLISELKKMMSLFIDMHAQNQNQSLYDKDTHIDVLDSFGKETIDGDIHKYRNSYNKLVSSNSELKRLRGNKNQRELEREIDLLKFQITEIDGANLSEEEYDELIFLRDRYRNSEKIFESLSRAFFELKDDEGNVEDRLGNAMSELDYASRYDSEINDVKNEVEEVYYTLQESISKVRNIRDSLDFEPSELERIEERVDVINNLRRKYGDSIAEIFEYRDKIEKRVEEIENLDKLTKELRDKIEKEKRIALEDGEKLREKRKEIAKKFEGRIIDELASLDIKNVQFMTKFEEKSMDEKGIDDVGFFISFNLGEDIKPLNKVASGGEMSRFMLALKSILSTNDGQSTLVFDEIDTGISGLAAQAVADKLEKLGSEKQIICVTHLPQIATVGQAHYKVYKESDSKRTYTRIEELVGDEREIEIARLISGEVTEKGIQNAQEMLNR